MRHYLIGTVKPGRVLPDVDQTGQSCWSASITVDGLDEILPFQFTGAGVAKQCMREIVKLVNSYLVIHE